MCERDITRNIKNKGFTLIEIVVTLSILGILAAGLSKMIAGPIMQYVTAIQRASIVDMSEQAFYLLEQDLIQSAPRSVRANGDSIEMLHIGFSARYLPDDGSGTREGVVFSTTAPLDQTRQKFRIFKQLPTALHRYYENDQGVQGLLIHHIHAYVDNDSNVPVQHINAYSSIENSHVFYRSGFKICSGNMPRTQDELGYSDCQAQAPTPQQAVKDIVYLDEPFHFSHASPHRHLFMIDTPITYRCEGGNLIRYSNYPVQEQMLSNADIARLRTQIRSVLVAKQVASCAFSINQDTTDPNSRFSAILSLFMRYNKNRPPLELVRIIGVRDDS